MKKRKAFVVSGRHMSFKYGKDIVKRTAIGDRYVDFWSKMGVNVYVVPNNIGNNLKSWLDRIRPDGIILTGGMGVHPKLWGAEVKKANNFSKDRENVDKGLINYAQKNNLPLLGICTGLHYLNVYFGGWLIQDLGKEVGKKVNHDISVHGIKIIGKEEISWLGERAKVNSYHSQGITKTGFSKELVAFAVCEEDDTIEAAYHPKIPMAAITWHPERVSPDDLLNKKIAKAFVNRTHFWKIK